MRIDLLAIAAIVACGCHGPATPHAGLRYPPLPSGWSEADGSLIPAWPDSTQYAISWMHDTTSEQLWLSKMVGRDSRGQPLWELRDTMSVPKFGRDRTLVYTDCSLEGKPDFEIVALLKDEDADSFRTVYSAWRADTHAERFRPVAASGIVCANESYGEP